MKNEKKDAQENNLRIIAGINRVEGFNPEAEAIPVERSARGEDSEYSSFLPVGKKKAWFRLAMPHGKISYKEIYPALDPAMPFAEKRSALADLDKVIVEVKVYEDKSDPEDAYIGDGLGVAYAFSLDDGADVSMRYPEMLKLARGAAESRALYNAGFGMQFYGKDELPLVQQIAADQRIVRVAASEAPAAKAPALADEVAAPTALSFAPEATEFLSEGTDAPTPTPVPAPTKRHRRTNAEIYNDDCDSLKALEQKVVEAQKSYLEATNEVSKATAKSRLSALEKEHDDLVKKIQKVVSKLEKQGVEFEVRNDIEFDFKALIASLPTGTTADATPEQPEPEVIIPDAPVEEAASVKDADVPAQEPTEDVPMASTCSFGPFAGQEFEDIFENNRNVLPWLLEKVSDDAEKAAIINLIRKDDDLAAQAQRKGLI